MPAKVGDMSKPIYELTELDLALLNEHVSDRRERKPVPVSGETTPAVRSLRERFVRIREAVEVPRNFHLLSRGKTRSTNKGSEINEAIETAADKDVPLDIAIRFREKGYDENDREKRTCSQ
jgi:hypothetical protein